MSVSIEKRKVSYKPMFEASVDSGQASHNTEEQLEQSIGELVSVDGGYGWVCALAIFLINAHTWGVSTVSLPVKNEGKVHADSA